MYLNFKYLPILCASQAFFYSYLASFCLHLSRSLFRPFSFGDRISLALALHLCDLVLHDDREAFVARHFWKTLNKTKCTSKMKEEMLRSINSATLATWLWWGSTIFLLLAFSLSISFLPRTPSWWTIKWSANSFAVTILYFGEQAYRHT